MVRDPFAPVPFIDEERVAAAIELTRFPVLDDEDHAATDTEAGLVRAVIAMCFWQPIFTDLMAQGHSRCSSMRVPVERDHGFRWKMITQSGGR
jgi:hypothetical protein